MSIDRYRGQVEHMASVASRAGFTGFEPELVMLGDDWSVSRLRHILDQHGLSLAAMVLVEEWRGPCETESERADAESVIKAVAASGGAKLVLCPFPGADRSDLAERQVNAMACMEAVAKRAADVGVHCTFHPNSPTGSVFRTAEDYRRMADLLPDLIGYTPDIGHIARGGMDPLTVIRQWRDRIDHVHVKDVAEDGTWAETGAGVVDVRGVLEHLAATDFTGWVTFEDESAAAETDPDQATAHNGDYVRTLKGGS
ncbi:inosose dehydratase [Microlunatus panaciterrae]|uniref:Inosose dehydratase n=1 Tax=Microlunatus panaciterrae TaxID=400768 RepID=A0ABS2RKF7_9ACTN|nr:sugar phosphate isomerase/epimerase [Microlunatus panaciterrae]MBM7799472.1 inosose dehydratase [Microlunatus panaciterrae]